MHFSAVYPVISVALAVLSVCTLFKWLRTRRRYVTGSDSLFVSADVYGTLVVHA